MRLSRGDIVLHQGEFFLVWECLARSIRVFPVTDAMEGFLPDDVLANNWPEMARAGHFANAAIGVTRCRMIPPNDLVKIPDLALDAADIAGVETAIHRLALRRGHQHYWPTFVGLDLSMAAPVFVS